MRSAPRRGSTLLAPATAPLRDGDMLAALDLGSNSFHMVVAQTVLGQLRVVDRLRETVRMAEGLDGFGGLAPDVRDRALACLSRFGQRVADIPPHRIRAVATNTVRQLRALAVQRQHRLLGRRVSCCRRKPRSGMRSRWCPGARKRAWSTSAWPTRNRRRMASCGW